MDKTESTILALDESFLLILNTTAARMCY